MSGIASHRGSWPLTALLVAVFFVAGIAGHDPWKPDEAYTFGLVLHILQTGDWIVPTLAGEPFMEKPPLYFIVAALTARGFSPALSLHDAARLATVLFVGAALAATALTASKVFGRGHAERSVLLMVSSIGLAQYAHEMITDTALLAGFALAMLGLAWARERPRLAGALLGTGVGIGFMSKGLVEPGMVGLAVALLPLFRAWRTRTFAASLAWALAFALPWLLVWPVALYRSDPALFDTWFWINNFGRYFGFAQLGADTEPWYYTRTLPWFTLPVGPLALWAVARHLRDPDEDAAAGLQLMVVLSAAILAVLTTSATARPLYALPLLAPLSVLGASVVDRIPAVLARATAIAFGLVALAVGVFAWSVWAYAVARGAPPAIPALLAWLPATFQLRIEPALVAVAAAATSLWLFTSARRGASWAHAWAASVVFMWSTVMTLWLPWIDDAKRFRETFVEIARRVPSDECLSSYGLGEPQRAMLDYYAGIKTRRIEPGRPPCDYHLVQTSSSRKPHSAPGGQWTLLWTGRRPGETEEYFSLYQRGTPENIAAARARSR